MKKYIVEKIVGIEVMTDKSYLMPFQLLLAILNNKNRKWYLRKKIAECDNFNQAFKIYNECKGECKTVKCENKIKCDLLLIVNASNDEIIKDGIYTPLYAHISMIDGYVLSTNGRPVKYADAQKCMNDKLLNLIKNEFEITNNQDILTNYEDIYRAIHNSEFVEETNLELEIFKNP